MTPLDLADPDVRAAPADIVAQAPPSPAGLPPVFLHCGWRTRGTWIWNQFRRQFGIADYYEPLAESLAWIRKGTLASIDADNWPSGHKGLDRPYFDGFRPLLAPTGPGVQGYRTRFATDDFFAAPDTPLPELERYLHRLIDTAQARGEQPVLKFCRSMGRIAWMQRRFPGAVHVAVLRNPFAQFGADWADMPRLGQVGMLLAEAGLTALGGEMVWPAPRLEAPVPPAMAPEAEAMLLSAMGRAAWAERQLAAVHGSRSWRVTAPLRWVRERGWRG